MEEERFENAYIVNEQGENIMWKGNKPIQKKRKQTVGDSHKKHNSLGNRRSKVKKDGLTCHRLKKKYEGWTLWRDLLIS